MSDHLVLFVDRLIRPGAVQSAASESSEVVSGPVGGGDGGGAGAKDGPGLNAAGPSSSATGEKQLEEDEGLDEEEPLIQTAECRICQEEDSLKDLETPCACSGSLKYAHRKCVQHWCNEKGDTICEICHQPYQPGYTAPPPPPNPDETAIDIGGGWTISGTPVELDPRLLAIAEAERHFLEAEYDDYAASSASGAAYCRSVALILMALLLLRHALGITDPDADDETSAFFSLFLLRAAGFLLPCYIMAWAISMLQRRRQRQEAAALAATQVAFVLQSGQRRGLQFAIASGRSAAPAPAAPAQPSGPAVSSPEEAV
ncbi:Zinc finger, RING-CH-type [Parasponia andersonii]|uniref:Zinc finger, RING-CH-type n=1 Tax=Parasponia andersonii TaxID=3476 RepID=A0A2P5AA91_PARAD|nr:Zinc finger, RING-CH-type [Parasponia andersonii]